MTILIGLLQHLLHLLNLLLLLIVYHLSFSLYVRILGLIPSHVSHFHRAPMVLDRHI